MDSTIVITAREISNGLTEDKLKRIEEKFGAGFLLVQYLKNSLVVSEYHVCRIFDELTLKTHKNIWIKANLNDLKNPKYLASLSEMKLDNQYTKAIHDIGLSGCGLITIKIKDLKANLFPNLKWFNWITIHKVGFGDGELTLTVHNKESLPTNAQADGNFTFSTTWVMVMGSSFWNHLMGNTRADISTGLERVRRMYENGCQQPDPVVEKVQKVETLSPAMEVYTIEEIKKVLDFLGLNHSIEDFEVTLKLIVKQRK